MAYSRDDLIDMAIKAVIEHFVRKGVEGAWELIKSVKKWVEDHPDEIKRIMSAAADVRTALAMLLQEIMNAITGAPPDEQRWNPAPEAD